MKKYKELTEQDFDLIRKMYEDEDSKEEAQKKLAKFYQVEERTIRKWANNIELGLLNRNKVNPAKVLIYDIETSRMNVKLFWTGKQYVGADKIVTDPSIISVSWKWLGESKVSHLTWDENHSDEKMMREFLKVYNSADMVIGINNDNFDNRWINARAAKYRFNVNTMIRSFDVQKEMKRVFRIPSYSMKYTAKYFDLDERKGEHEGMIMWQMIEDGTPAQQKEYLKKMVDYNVQDILTTEDLYISLRKYFGHKMHFGTLNGDPKFTCPSCGGSDIVLEKSSTTPAGTVQRFMRCKEDETQFRLTNRVYIDFLEFKLREDNIE